MTRIFAIIAVAATIATAPFTTASAQAVVSSDCRISRFIEAYAWQALDDAERNDVSQDLINGLRVYARTVQQSAKKACGRSV